MKVRQFQVLLNAEGDRTLSHSPLAISFIGSSGILWFIILFISRETGTDILPALIIVPPI